MKKLLLLLLVAAGVFFWVRHTRSPDVQLAARLKLLCELSERNVKTPERGVDELFSWLGEQTPALMSNAGELLVEIERIDDDRKHDERARTAARRIHSPLVGCSGSLERFADAIDSNPAASDKLEHGAERLERTLSILIGEDRQRMHSARAWLHALSK